MPVEIKPSNIRSGKTNLQQDASVWSQFFKARLRTKVGSHHNKVDPDKMVFALAIFDKLAEDQPITADWLATVEKQFPEIASQRPLRRTARMRKQATAKVSALLFGENDASVQNYELDKALRQIIIVLRRELKVAQTKQRADAAQSAGQEKFLSTAENSYSQEVAQLSFLRNVADQAINIAIPTIRDEDYANKVNACLDDEDVRKVYQTALVKAMGEANQNKQIDTAPLFQTRGDIIVDLYQLLLDPKNYANDPKREFLANSLVDKFLLGLEESKDIAQQTKDLVSSVVLHRTAVKLLSEIEGAFNGGDIADAINKFNDFKACCSRMYETPVGMKVQSLFQKITEDLQATFNQLVARRGLEV